MVITMVISKKRTDTGHNHRKKIAGLFGMWDELKQIAVATQRADKDAANAKRREARRGKVRNLQTRL